LDTNKSYIKTEALSTLKYSKLKDYVMLVKLRLSLVVVISSVLGYMIAAKGAGNVIDIIKISIGGFLVTGAANALNQVLEKDFDVLMTRTADRPVATGRMKSSEAVMFAGVSCLFGISILATFNPVTAFIGMLSLILYAFVYTPLKRYSTLAVAVGAIPGALPVMIGVTAFEGTVTLFAFALFVIQFLWQFPHFWSIGFLGFEDYNRAGYKLLPEEDGKINRNLGLSSIFYAAMIIPVAIWIFLRMDAGLESTFSVILCTLVYIYFSYNFHKKFERTSALKLMFFSFFYLPLVLISYWLF
jgi:protoheme IX farnesyltransferase